MAEKFSFIMMTCGYVESCQTSWLLYGTHFLGSDGFEDRGEAIRELALDLYAKYHDEYLSAYERRYASDVKDCCRDELIRNNKANFCSGCGKHIKDREFVEDGFMEYVRGLHSSTCDSYGDAEQVATRDLVWWPWSMHEFMNVSKESVIWIGENAEWVLLDALYDAKPELKTEDSTIGESDYTTYFKENKQPSYR